MMKNFKGIDLTAQNWHEEFAEFWPEHSKNLKNLHFNGLLLIKVYNVWAKKVQRCYVWWNWRLMQILKENWLVLSKMTWRIWQIFTRALESLKIWTLIGSFYLKQKIYKLKIYRGVICHAMKNDVKFEEELTCQFKFWHEEFDELDPSTQKSQKFIL